MAALRLPRAAGVRCTGGGGAAAFKERWRGGVGALGEVRQVPPGRPTKKQIYVSAECHGDALPARGKAGELPNSPTPLPLFVEPQ